jgi:hypothetical protein
MDVRQDGRRHTGLCAPRAQDSCFVWPQKGVEPEISVALQRQVLNGGSPEQIRARR